MKRKAIVIGSSGRVGQALVRELVALYETVIVITRTQPATMSENMHVYPVQNFDALESTIGAMAIGADTDAFSCLGVAKTDAASRDEFYQVNVLFNLAFAKACREKGVERFFYLSKDGADKPERNDELIAKADVEYYLTTLGFNDVCVFRLNKLTPAKTSFSLKTLSSTGLRFAKQAALSLVRMNKTEALSPRRVAAAMALVAYRRYRQKRQAPIMRVVEHGEMVAMTKESVKH
ncbi:hypothetical protein B0181_10495 [Moraxella caviae]|uniref:NAD-dependent epimerase/dehydratase domain-containing protein n=1 Tax=Moraxella caviae TaxID=34060 RepID=A0A1S9ZV36_9GAMM|nr:NAD-dependent epimerase/dehydratase family protein [Moraxella caviae]OOR87319.1 hypothetical protein B0181_10495 [Moraxella caviae]STZ14619.1 Uncharacterised protein [Moraxella caviae]VEW11388.1 Uncharacterised protein [Moraxella caviae]